MGIPHLITYLRPFASSVNLAGQNVVIDGPGLAYHVWHICLATQSRFRNPFEATPTYELLGETVVRFLDELQSHGVCVKKIFFDGFLPPLKFQTRLSRVAGYTKQLSDYHQSWPQIIPSMYTSTAYQRTDLKLFNVDAIPSSFIKLPAAPFLVPAIIESLSACSRYDIAVEVVPGEADLYCARFVRNNGGVVLTGDSDLLVHDLGAGAVNFFKDLDSVTSGNIESLVCVQYKVGEIADRLLLPKSHGLRSLAFEMTMNTHGNFRELLQQAVKLKAVSLHGTMYQEFAAEFTPKLDLGMIQDAGTNLDQNPSLFRHLKSLDPRISEFLLQSPRFAHAAGLPEPLLPPAADKQGHILVFLPFLLDNPSRTSAWETSTYVRQLAYALINLVLPDDEQFDAVVEYRRLQNGTRGRERSVPGNQDIPAACASLLELFDQIRGGIVECTPQDMWRALAVYQDVVFNMSNGKAGLNNNAMTELDPTKPVPFRFTWDGIHSYAQSQGSYYSFRLLKQILKVVLSCDEAKVLSPVLNRLQLELELLPTLAELTNLTDHIRTFGGPRDRVVFGLIRKILNLGNDVCATIAEKMPKQRKRHKNAKSLKIPNARRQRSSNSYGVLSIEGNFDHSF